MCLNGDNPDSSSFLCELVHDVGHRARSVMGFRADHPEDILLWYGDCFELKAILASGSGEKLLPLSLTTKKNLN